MKTQMLNPYKLLCWCKFPPDWCFPWWPWPQEHSYPSETCTDSCGSCVGCASEPCHYRPMSSQPKSCKNSYYSYLNNNALIKSQFCTCHDSWAVVTCAKLWLVWIIICHLKAMCILVRFGLWAHKRLVKRVPGDKLSVLGMGHQSFHLLLSGLFAL